MLVCLYLVTSFALTQEDLIDGTGPRGLAQPWPGFLEPSEPEIVRTVALCHLRWKLPYVYGVRFRSKVIPSLQPMNPKPLNPKSDSPRALKSCQRR